MWHIIIRIYISNPKQVCHHQSFEFTQFSVSMMQESRLTVPKPWTSDNETFISILSPSSGNYAC